MTPANICINSTLRGYRFFRDLVRDLTMLPYGCIFLNRFFFDRDTSVILHGMILHHTRVRATFYGVINYYLSEMRCGDHVFVPLKDIS